MLQESDAEDVSIQRDLFICESAVLIKSSESAQLLCGLRDGTLMMFRASLLGGIRISPPAIHHLFKNIGSMLTVYPRQHSVRAHKYH